MPPETFREFIDSLKDDDLSLQPYQRDLMARLYGMPVRIIEDPIDPRVGYLFDEAALLPRLPEPTPMFVISTPWHGRGLYERLVENFRKMPLYPGRPAATEWWVDEARVPERPSQSDLARWEDDGGR